MKRLPRWISAARFQGCARCRCTHKDDGERNVGKKVGNRHETWWNKRAFAQHPAPSGWFFSPNCFWFWVFAYWQSYEEQVVVVAYSLACFVSSLQSIFVNTAPVPRDLYRSLGVVLFCDRGRQDWWACCILCTGYRGNSLGCGLLWVLL